MAPCSVLVRGVLGEPMMLFETSEALEVLFFVSASTPGQCKLRILDDNCKLSPQSTARTYIPGPAVGLIEIVSPKSPARNPRHTAG
jgi:hypothetical protein